MKRFNTTQIARFNTTQTASISIASRVPYLQHAKQGQTDEQFFADVQPLTRSQGRSRRSRKCQMCRMPDRRGAQNCRITGAHGFAVRCDSSNPGRGRAALPPPNKARPVVAGRRPLARAVPKLLPEHGLHEDASLRCLVTYWPLHNPSNGGHGPHYRNEGGSLVGSFEPKPSRLLPKLLHPAINV